MMVRILAQRGRAYRPLEVPLAP
jgi:hypothetical protein